MFVERSKLHKISDLVTNLLSSQGYVCIDAEWEAQSRTLRLYIDHAKGIDLDECAKISGLLVESRELDEILPFDFNLEISSPGIERPIRTLDHFREAFNEAIKVDVRLTAKHNGRRKGVGVITNISPGGEITMKTDEGIFTFPWELVLKATKVVDWDKIQDRPM